MDHMTDNEFQRACSLVAQSYGLDMAAKRVLLECRLSREREQLGLSTYSDYLNLIESGEDRPARERFVDLITTHYTYFMRESSQLAFLQDRAFPELLQRKPDRTWRILCAGCSTGEECYTVSMLVEDFTRLHTIPDVKITGIDVSRPALDLARKAAYPRTHVDKSPRHWLAAYFDERDGEFSVAPGIRQRVSFKTANLAEERPFAGTFDLILCRNVIIYFDRKTRQRALESLARHLSEEGYLVLGHAEIASNLGQLAYRGDSIYQRKTEEAPL